MSCNCIEVGHSFFKDVGSLAYNRLLFPHNPITKDWLDHNTPVHTISTPEGGVGYLHIWVKFNLHIDNKISLNSKSLIYDILYSFIFSVT